MDINEARQHLLNRFPRKYRRHIIDFARSLENIEADVLVFTARKSACFFHCLEHLRLWVPAQVTVTTDRLIDHDMTWLRGKRVAIVDEVIVSGTSLFRLWQALTDAGVASIKIHALFVNQEWFVKEFFDSNCLAPTYIALDGPEAQSLGTTIVRAFYSIPRPYSIDYPMSSWLTARASETVTLTRMPGWHVTETGSVWAPNEGDPHGTSLAFYRFEPNTAHHDKRFRDVVGVERSELALAKIRLYGRWETVDNRRTYHFRIVPYVIIDEISHDDLCSAFSQLAETLPENDASRLRRSCSTGKSKLRAIHYVLAARLARYWCGTAGDIGVPMTFLEDPREFSFIFPESIHGPISKLIEAEGLSLELPSVRKGASPCGTSRSAIAPEIFLNLLDPFCKLYDNEIVTRQRAQQEKGEFFSNERKHGRRDRLGDGLTISDLTKHLDRNGFPEGVNQLSNFIDIAVDSGIAVPITLERSGQDGAILYSRAYRHGEETYLIRRDLALFHMMMSCLAQRAAKGINELRLPDKHLLTILKPNRIPRLVLEKALVLFLRYAISQGVFPEVYDNGAPANIDGVRVGVGYDLLGARVARGEHRPTELPGSSVFVNWLIDQGILVRDGTTGYEVNPSWRNPYAKPDKAQEKEAIRFATALAEGIVCIAQEASRLGNGRAIAKRIDKSLVALTTCESVGATLLALGAELRRVDSELGDLGVGEEGSVLIADLVTNDRFVRAVLVAVNSAYSKIVAFVLDQAKKDAERISEGIKKKDLVYAGHWDDVWEAARLHQSADASHLQSGQLVNSSAVLIQALLFIHWLRLRVFLEQGARVQIRDARRSYADKLKDLSDLISSLRKTNQQLHEKLALALERARDVTKEFPEEPISDPRTHKWALEKLVRLRQLAKEHYKWIDSTALGNGRIPRLQQFDSILSIRLQTDENGWVNELCTEFSTVLTDVTKRLRARKAPREYSQSGVKVPGDGYFPTPELVDGGVRGCFLGEGRGGAQWLGYLMGKLVQTIQKSEYTGLANVRFVVTLGLEDSRRAHRTLSDGTTMVPDSTQSIIETGYLLMAKDGGLMSITVDNVGKKDYQEAFLSELTGVLKGLMPTQAATDNVSVYGAGGTFAYDRYESKNVLSTKPPSPTVAWVVVVEDEGATLLQCLDDHNLEYSFKERPDRTQYVHTAVAVDGGEVALQIIMAPDQGNTVMSSLLGSIASSIPGLACIVVSGICCSFGDASTLTKVVLPVVALDMQQSVHSTRGDAVRSKAPELRPDALDLVRWYLAVRKKRELSEQEDPTNGIKIIDNAVMVSDNTLMRDGRPEEKHRKLAREFSTKAVALDMETAGAFRWAQINGHHPPTVVVKGMSDLGKSNKRDDDNRYLAGMNAMRVSLDFIRFVGSMKRDRGTVSS